MVRICKMTSLCVQVHRALDTKTFKCSKSATLQTRTGVNLTFLKTSPIPLKSTLHQMRGLAEINPPHTIISNGG